MWEDVGRLKKTATVRQLPEQHRETLRNPIMTIILIICISLRVLFSQPKNETNGSMTNTFPTFAVLHLITFDTPTGRNDLWVPRHFGIGQWCRLRHSYERIKDTNELDNTLTPDACFFSVIPDKKGFKCLGIGSG